MRRGEDGFETGRKKKRKTCFCPVDFMLRVLVSVSVFFLCVFFSYDIAASHTYLRKNPTRPSRGICITKYPRPRLSTAFPRFFPISSSFIKVPAPCLLLQDSLAYSLSLSSSYILLIMNIFRITSLLPLVLPLQRVGLSILIWKFTTVKKGPNPRWKV